MALKAITANRLRDGTVVFLGPEGRWVESLDEAALFDGAEADAALADARERSDRDRFGVDVYAFELSVEDGRRRPVKTRERIRAFGPTVRADLGKQAAA